MEDAMNRFLSLLVPAVLMLAGCMDEPGMPSGPAESPGVFEKAGPAGEGVIPLHAIVRDPARGAQTDWVLIGEVAYRCYCPGEPLIMIDLDMDASLENEKGIVLQVMEKSIVKLVLPLPRFGEFVTSWRVDGRSDGALLMIRFKVDQVEQKLLLDGTWLALPGAVRVPVSTM
jgi:hypothetical protein